MNNDPHAQPGPRLRSDVFDIYVFRRGADLQFLQLKRAEAPLLETWQPLMGHVEQGEPTAAAMWRELDEEVGLRREQDAFRGAWALEGVHPFYLVRSDCIYLSPRFVVEAAANWEPRLNHENSEVRWISRDDVDRCFMFPGQRGAIAEILHDIIPCPPGEFHLRVP